MSVSSYQEFTNATIIPGSFSTNRGGRTGVYFAFKSQGVQSEFRGDDARVKDPHKGPIPATKLEAILNDGCELIAILRDERASYGHERQTQWRTELRQQGLMAAVITTEANPLIQDE